MTLHGTLFSVSLFFQKFSPRPSKVYSYSKKKKKNFNFSPRFVSSFEDRLQLPRYSSYVADNLQSTWGMQLSIKLVLCKKQWFIKANNANFFHDISSVVNGLFSFCCVWSNSFWKNIPTPTLKVSSTRMISSEGIHCENLKFIVLGVGLMFWMEVLVFFFRDLPSAFITHTISQTNQLKDQTPVKYEEKH